MHDAIRAEILKARSGLWMLAVLCYGLLLPLLSWQVFGGSLLSSLAACPIAAAFLGCYLVTRDFYYGSIERTVVMNHRENVFVAKLVAAFVAGAFTGVVGVVGWRVAALFADYDAWSWPTLAGCVVACALAAVFGAAIGWVLPNYYLATFVALVLPLAVEGPIATLYPEIGRFLPSNAFAGIVGVTPGMFTGWLSAAIALLWVAVAVVSGRILVERRALR